MARKRTTRGRTPRPTRQDATIRNVRAAQQREAKVKLTVATLTERVDELQRSFDRIVSALRALATL